MTVENAFCEFVILYVLYIIPANIICSITLKQYNNTLSVGLEPYACRYVPCILTD